MVYRRQELQRAEPIRYAPRQRREKRRGAPFIENLAMLAAKGALGEFGRSREADIDRQAAETLYGRQMEMDRQRAAVAAKVAEDKERRLREMEPGTFARRQMLERQYGGPQQAEQKRVAAQADIDVVAKDPEVATAERGAGFRSDIEIIAPLEEAKGTRMARQEEEAIALKAKITEAEDRAKLQIKDEAARVGEDKDSLTKIDSTRTSLIAAFKMKRGRIDEKAAKQALTRTNRLLAAWKPRGAGQSSQYKDLQIEAAIHAELLEGYIKSRRSVRGGVKNNTMVVAEKGTTFPDGSTRATYAQVQKWRKQYGDQIALELEVHQKKGYTEQAWNNSTAYALSHARFDATGNTPQHESTSAKPGDIVRGVMVGGGKGGGTKALDRVRGLKGGTLGQEKTISTSLASFESKLTATVSQMTNEGMFDDKGNVLEEFRDTEQAQQLGRLNKQIDRWEEIQGDIDRGTITAQQGVEKVKKDLPRAAPGPTDAQLQQGTERHLGSIRTSSFNPFQGTGSREEQTEKFARASRGANQAISFMKGKGGVAVGLTKQLKDEKEKRLKMFADDVFADIAQEVGKTKDKNGLDALQEEGERLRRKLGLSRSHPSVTKIRAALADVGVEAGRERRHQVEEIQSQKGFGTPRQSGPGPQMLQLQ